MSNLSPHFKHILTICDALIFFFFNFYFHLFFYKLYVSKKKYSAVLEYIIPSSQISDNLYCQTANNFLLKKIDRPLIDIYQSTFKHILKMISHVGISKQIMLIHIFYQ